MTTGEPCGLDGPVRKPAAIDPGLALIDTRFSAQPY